MTDARRQGIKNVGLIGSSIGVGTAIGVAAASVLRSKPELIVDLVKAFGPMFLIIVAIMHLIDRNAGKFIDVQREGAVATQQLADAVNRIAKKDDQVERERDLLLNDMAHQIRTVCDVVSEIKERQTAVMAFKATAGGQG